MSDKEFSTMIFIMLGIIVVEIIALGVLYFGG